MFQSLKQWLFGKKVGKTIRNRRIVPRRSFRPLTEQLEARLALATLVEYNDVTFTLKFTVDASENITLIDDPVVSSSNQVLFSGDFLPPDLAEGDGEIATLDTGSLSGGSGYQTVLEYDVNLQGGGGSFATAHVIVTNGIVTSVVVTGGGSGYSAGTVTLTADENELGGQVTAPFSATATVAGGAVDTGAATLVTGGSGYYNTKTYLGVALTGGSGSGATADITVADGSVSSVVLDLGGSGYVVGDTLSAAAADLGGGSPIDFSIDVAILVPDAYFATDNGGISYYTRDSISVESIVIDSTAFGSTLTIGAGWEFNIPVSYEGSDDTDDVLDISAVAPRTVSATALGAVTGYDGDVNINKIVFTALDTVQFGGAGDELAVELSVPSGDDPLDFIYEALGAGAGKLTEDSGLGNILNFTGLNASDAPLVLAVKDENGDSKLGNLTVKNVGLTNHSAIISGADSDSGSDAAHPGGRMFVAFGDTGAADLDTTTPTAELAYDGHTTGNDTIEIGSRQAVATSLALVSGGSGYSVGDVLLVNGGLGNSPTQIIVDAVSSGVITAAHVDTNLDATPLVSHPGSYALFPTGTLSTTAAGSPGTGATFSLTSAYVPMTTPALSVSGLGGTDVITVLSDLTLGIDGTGNLALTAETINLNAASIDTTGNSPAGDATFTGAVVLGANVAINTDDGSAGGDVWFTSTVNADSAVTRDRTLTITALDGTVQFDGAIGNSQALADLDVQAGGGILLNNAVITVNDLGGNTVTFEGPITLGANVTITTDSVSSADNNVLFKNDTYDTTIDADNAATQNRTFTVLAGVGTVTFEGEVGNIGGRALADLDVTAATIYLTAATYNVNDAAAPATVVTFTGPVVLQNDTVDITTDDGAAGNSVTFTSTINADDDTGGDRSLSINAGTGVNGGIVTFKGNIGTGALGALAALEVTAATTNIEGATIQADDSDAAAAEVKFSGGAVILKNNVTVDTDRGGGDSDVTFLSTIDADNSLSFNRTLLVTAGDAAATFGASVGSTTALADFDVTADTINLNAATFNVDDGSGGATVTLDGKVVLGAATVSFDTDGTADSNIQFTDTIKSTGGNRALSLNADTGNINFDAAVGGAGLAADKLSSLTITKANNVTFSSSVRTTGAITQVAGDGLTTFSGAVVAEATSSIKTKNITVTTTGPGSLNVTGDLTLEALNNIDLQTGTSLTASGLAALKFGAADGDSVTINGTVTANTATVTGTVGKSNTLTIQYRATQVLNITTGGLVYDGGSGAGTDRLIALGHSGADTFGLTSSALTHTAPVADSAVNYSNVEIVTLSAGDGIDTIGVSGGGTTSTTINGEGGGDIINLTAGVKITVNGGADDDTITVSGGGVGVGNNNIINGDGGGTSSNDTINVTAAATATLNGNDGNDLFTLSAALTGSIVAGNGDDTVNLTSSGTHGSVSGTVDGGVGTDTLSYAGYTLASVTITISGAGTIDGFKGGGNGLTGTSAFNNINTFTGATSTTIKGLNAVSTWLITGPNSGTYTSTSPARTFSFTGATTLLGGTNVDTFKSVGNNTFAGSINGGSGKDVIDYSSHAIGFGNTFNLSGLNKGNIDGTNNFEGIESLIAGAGVDTFNLPAVGSIGGKIDGGGGVDTLNYPGRTTGVTVDLTAGTATGTGGIVIVSGSATIENVTGTNGHDVIFGSEVDNVLNGGTGGNDILSGRGGVDTLTNENKIAAGRSILIGGDGADALRATLVTAGSVGDLMISGSTIYDTNKTALTAILKEWTSSAAYATRVAHIQGTLSGGLNKTYKFNTGTVNQNTTVGETLHGGGPTQTLVVNWYVVAFTSDVSNNRTGPGGETITVI